jgi:hypothetical protein
MKQTVTELAASGSECACQLACTAFPATQVSASLSET